MELTFPLLLLCLFGALFVLAAGLRYGFPRANPTPVWAAVALLTLLVWAITGAAYRQSESLLDASNMCIWTISTALALSGIVAVVTSTWWRSQGWVGVFVAAFVGEFGAIVGIVLAIFVYLYVWSPHE